jgi:hypothetical protein
MGAQAQGRVVGVVLLGQRSPAELDRGLGGWDGGVMLAGWGSSTKVVRIAAASET